ncbi:GAD-like domain-containing protein [Actinomyces ruminis]|uniref:GAD-related domain-containing protein n=1 Tax=Actinomyces ruminis TaxID=1937003 RepID=A0ABX4M8T7_9ACTO|nr:GAD-like domain-containing protein [Actinomyces ruminis]PHP51831.1 hypothetical protein BW737_014285 [Actinomyces ruminis]
MSDDDDAPASGGGSFEPHDAGVAGLWDFTPEPEPVDPVEQDALTDKIIDRDLIGAVEGAGLAPMGVGRAVPEEYFHRFAHILPRSVLRVWRRFGFEGFGKGLFWITDPLQWAPIVGEWLEPVRDRLPFTDTFYCLARNAMGEMYLWGEHTGHSLDIDPTHTRLVIDQLSIRSFSDPDVRQQAGRAIFISQRISLLRVLRMRIACRCRRRPWSGWGRWAPTRCTGSCCRRCWVGPSVWITCALWTRAPT